MHLLILSCCSFLDYLISLNLFCLLKGDYPSATLPVLSVWTIYSVQMAMTAWSPIFSCHCVLRFIWDKVLPGGLLVSLTPVDCTILKIILCDESKNIEILSLIWTWDEEKETVKCKFVNKINTTSSHSNFTTNPQCCWVGQRFGLSTVLIYL